MLAKWGRPCILAGLLMTADLLQGCQSLIAGYSLEAYKNATMLKAETAALIDKSGDDYSSHKPEVEALNTKLDAAYEFAAGIPHNELSTEQWRVLRDPNRDLYGGYIRQWRERRKMGAVVREEKKIQIGRAFDFIICLEANKQSPRSCSETQALPSGAPVSAVAAGRGGQQ